MPVEPPQLERLVAAPPRVSVRPARQGGGRRLRRIAYLVTPLLVLGSWQWSSQTGLLPDTVLGSVTDVLRAGVRLAANGTLGDAMLVSLRRVAAGLAIGLLIGGVLALVAGLSRTGEYLVDPSVQMLRTVPFVGLVPLLIIWLGIGEASKDGLVAVGVAFPVYLNLYAGIRGTDPGLIEMAHTIGLNRRQVVLHVILPGAVPAALVGLRYALGLAWLALVFAEEINATSGIGYLMNNARAYFQTDVIVLCLVVYAALGLATDLIVRFLERTLLAWRPTFVAG